MILNFQLNSCFVYFKNSIFSEWLEMLHTEVLEYDIVPKCLPSYIKALTEAKADRNYDDIGWITEGIN